VEEAGAAAAEPGAAAVVEAAAVEAAVVEEAEGEEAAAVGVVAEVAAVRLRESSPPSKAGDWCSGTGNRRRS
jgi:hypothetical protein